MANQLRRTMSPPEVRLWLRLRERTDGRPVFRRQHPIGPYVVDFYCAAARLAVEVDGMDHGMGDRPQRDARRDEWLASRGIDTLRIPAGDVLRRLDEALEAIFMTVRDRVKGAAPPPPPRRDGPPPP
jgi:very-short-patch-repair endonuclease